MLCLTCFLSNLVCACLELPSRFLGSRLSLSSHTVSARFQGVLCELLGAVLHLQTDTGHTINLWVQGSVPLILFQHHTNMELQRSMQDAPAHLVSCAVCPWQQLLLIKLLGSWHSLVCCLLCARLHTLQANTPLALPAWCS